MYLSAMANVFSHLMKILSVILTKVQGMTHLITKQGTVLHDQNKLLAKHSGTFSEMMKMLKQIDAKVSTTNGMQIDFTRLKKLSLMDLPRDIGIFDDKKIKPILAEPKAIKLKAQYDKRVLEIQNFAHLLGTKNTLPDGTNVMQTVVVTTMMDTVKCEYLINLFHLIADKLLATPN
jgi:hypothetical protein